MQVTILGTSSMVPTKTRNHSAVLLSYGPEGILFDCGEGTQRQIKIAGHKLTKVTRILITHWHGDHVLGLPGLIQSLCGEEYSKTLHIYGPPGTKQRFSYLQKVFEADVTIQMVIEDIKPGVVYENEDFCIEARKMEHGTLCFGYSFTEKDRRRMKLKAIDSLGIPHGPLLGKLQKGEPIIWKGKKIEPEAVTYLVKGQKISYITDTRPCRDAIELAKGSDLMICESTYINADAEKAHEYMHMTAGQAAQLAEAADVKRLILTHFSQRYKDSEDILIDARDVFRKAEMGYDLMKIKF